MAHEHHAHTHSPGNYSYAFFWGIILNTGFVVIELIYGYLSHSLALIADAGHNFSDVLGLALAWGASVLSQAKPSGRYTYGFGRSSILAALANALVLLVVMGGLSWEAVQRLSEPRAVGETTVIVVALIGIVVNSFTAWLFASGRKTDLNLRGAFLHLASDALVSFGVVVAGLVILKTGFNWLDPVVSLVISGIVVLGTWQLLVDALNLAMDGIPDGLDYAAVRAYLLALPDVQEVHDLHIWGMSTTQTALTAHLVMPLGTSGDQFLGRVATELHNQFAIEHVTLQIEEGCVDSDCALGRLSHN